MRKEKGKKILSLLLVAALIFTLQGISVRAMTAEETVADADISGAGDTAVLSNSDIKSYFAGGSGTNADPYQISNAEQFDAIRNDIEAHYILINNIDFSELKSWRPIGTQSEPFMGTLNGAGYTVKNLMLSSGSGYGNSGGYLGGTITWIGLFGYIKESTIKNINIEIGSCKTYYAASIIYLGGAAGYAQSSTFEKVSVKGSDLVAEPGASTWNYCGGYAGGIVGYADASTKIIKSYNECNISINCWYYNTAVGGISGCGGVISQCFNSGSITGSGEEKMYIGGVTGNCSGTITDSYNHGNIYISNCKNYGGISGSGKNSIYTSYSVGNILKNKVKLENSYCITGITNVLSENDMKNMDNYIDFDFQKIWTVRNEMPVLKFIVEEDSKTGDSASIANSDIIARVSEYTSDQMYAQFDQITNSGYSYETKYKLYQSLFQSYGITDVKEGIQYLSNTTDKRYAYLNLVTDEIYCANNFRYWLKNTPNGIAAQVVLFGDGLIFSGEVNDWVNFTTYVETDFPGVSKYKTMLYDFMDATSDKIEIMSQIKLVSDMSSKVTGAAKLKANNLIAKLNRCSGATEASRILKSSEAMEVWASLAEVKDSSGNFVRDDNGSIKLTYKLDTSSGFGQFAKAMGYATKTVSIANMALNDVLDLLTLERV